MKISTKGRYALVIMSYLAKNRDRFVSLKEISDNEGISFKYLEKIMINLNKKDYFLVERGNKGGYQLKYENKDYNIGDILRSVEGDLVPVSCILDDNYCPNKKNCSSYDFWEGLYEQIINYVDSKTLSDYVKDGRI